MSFFVGLKSNFRIFIGIIYLINLLKRVINNEQWVRPSCKGF